MNCPACAHENRLGAKFCEECAAPLKRLCASCSAELRPSAKFCDACGTPVGAPGGATASVESTGARKVVTIVFADLVGSTALHERLDPESARRFMERYYAAMRTAVDSHGGTVTQFLGDGVKAVFGIPRVAEDDAIRAVRAAVEMQRAFRELAELQEGSVGKTGLRVAVNTGEVVASDASEIIGDPVNVAARLQEQGRDGDVVIGQTTHQLVSALVTVEPLGSFTLKGRTEAVSAYRVASLDRPAGVAATAFVGRADELIRIESVYEAAVAKPATALAVLVGSPGLGKSRLIEEFARRRGNGATVIRATCDAAGGASFAPLADALRTLPDLDAVVSGSDAERARIVDGVRALLAGSPASPEETFFVVRRLLSALAATKPVVLVIDDLHWAEPLLLDLVEHLVQWGGGVPLLVLIGARPELRDLRSTLVTPGGLVSQVITLAGLDASAAMRLAANVIGAADLPASVAAKVLATSEGNPLFVGELVRMLVHEGALKRDGERWTAGTALAALEMPPTIQALLAARIERLRLEERAVLERASVVGRTFSRSAVAELLPRDVADLDARLESLQRAELIERDTGWFLGEPALRFHHILIRDAAYRRILKGTRAELHARFADWVEARAGESLEHDETIGWHLEQAHQHLRELGPIDATGRTLGERAAARLSAAGRRALARDDVSLAAGLLRRALDRLDRADATRAELALDWCEALLAAGDVGSATAALEELDRFAASDARLRAWHTCFTGQLTSLTAPQRLNEAADAVATAARDFAALGDVAGEGKAHFVHAQAFSRLGKVGACEAALDRALAAARRAGDRRRANTVLAVAPLAALWGPSPVTRASGRCLDVVRVLRITQGAPAVEAVALSCQGVLEALRGRTDAARRMIASARKMVEELGITQRLFEADVFAARIDLLDGNAAAAERGLRGAFEGLRELGLGIDAARAAALLARALLALDRAAEAEALTHESEALAGDDLQAAIAWRGARAEALARRGEIVEAVALASEAVEIAAATDALLDHADARLALAAALRAAGRDSEADTEERHATELWEAKGATLLAERARREGQRPAAVAKPPGAQVVAAHPVRLRGHAKRATASAARFEAAVAARDVAALDLAFSDPCVVIYHATGVTYGRREQLSAWKSILRAEHATYRREVLATLGDSVELWRHWISIYGLTEAAVASFGATEFEEVVVGEDDGHGRYRRFEIFPPHQLGHALARAYERHAELLPEGPERARAAATARSVRVVAPGGFDLDRYTEVFRSDVEITDHRLLGWGASLGPEDLFRGLVAASEVGDELVSRPRDVLALTHDALLVRWLASGVGRESGGEFEWAFFRLFGFDHDGRVAHYELFDVDPEGEADALARFDALVGSETTRPESPFSNAASQLVELGAFRHWSARDWDGIVAQISPAMRMDDRRRIMRLEIGYEEFLAQFRMLFDQPGSRWRFSLLATRGERLSLHRTIFEADDVGGGGALAFDEHLSLAEIDADGRWVASVTFDPGDLDAAYAELDARYEAGEDKAHGAYRTIMRAFAQAAESHDWDPVRCLCSETLVERDHRPLAVLGTTRGAEAWVENFRVLGELAPDSRYRVNHFRSSARGFCTVGIWEGTREGGRYELPLVAVLELDDQTRIARVDIFDNDQLAQARARYHELESATKPSAPFANASTRLRVRMMEAWSARDWDGVMAVHATEPRADDRRRIVSGRAAGEFSRLHLRVFFDVPRSRWTFTPIATRGERLALYRATFEGQVDDAGGPLAIDCLDVDEVGADGLLHSVVLFDVDDLDAAFAELDARWQAGEGALHPRASTWQRDFAATQKRPDPAAIADFFTSTFVARDHRLVGWGTLDGPVAFLEMLRTLNELAPDAALRVDHVRTTKRGVLSEGAWVGTRDGGAFESPSVAIVELDADGRAVFLDLYDPHHLDEALARFETLRPDSLRIPPNAATRASDRQRETFLARDWDGQRALVDAEFVYEDHGRWARVTGDVENWIVYVQYSAQSGFRVEITLLGALGDRICLELLVFRGKPGGDALESDRIRLFEVDAQGRLSAAIYFDPDDRVAAFSEALTRFEAGEAVGRRALAPFFAFTRARRNREWGTVRDCIASDLVVTDHRLLGLGVLDRDSWIASLQASEELSVGLAFDLFRVLAWNDHGIVTAVRRYGTIPDGGGPFENVFLSVSVSDGERIAHYEIFDEADEERAVARLGELCAAIET